MHHGVGLCMATVLCGKGAGAGREQQGFCISLGMNAVWQSPQEEVVHGQMMTHTTHTQGMSYFHIVSP